MTMSDDFEIDKLAEQFRALGAPDPRGWAESQVREGTPQLARYLFLRQAWRKVVADDDPSWIARAIGASVDQPHAPYAGVGHALRRLKTLGATDQDITDLVRGMQAELLFSLCYLLDDPSIEEPMGQGISWALIQTNDDGEAIEALHSLHEDVLTTDPTGREMRPHSDA